LITYICTAQKSILSSHIFRSKEFFLTLPFIRRLTTELMIMKAIPLAIYTPSRQRGPTACHMEARIVMLQAWLQAVKPRSPSRGLTSQAKPNPRLLAGLGLGLGWPKPKPRAQAAAWRGQNDGTTLVLKCVKLTLHKS
jgi:hypothetical protein